jgi:hypothetical protein
MSNEDKVIYFPHDKEDESKGGIWIPLEAWNLHKEIIRKIKEKEAKEIWKK